MKMLTMVGAVLALACGAAPVAAQRVNAAPTAQALGGTEGLVAYQGAGCAAGTTPCQLVAIKPPQLATYLTPTFQARDADLDAIAALSTTTIGRSLLTQADAAALRSVLGVSATGADTTYLYRANNLSGLTDASAARGNLGLGSIATQAASAVAITGGTIAGLSSALPIASGGTGGATVAAARSSLGVSATGADPSYCLLTGCTLSGNLTAGGKVSVTGTSTLSSPVTFTGDEAVPSPPSGTGSVFRYAAGGLAFQGQGSTFDIIFLNRAQSAAALALNAATNDWTFGGNLTAPGTVTASALQISAASTVAALPACNAAARGTRRIVTDATAPSFLGALSGGGSVVAPALCNGSAWVAG